MRACCVICGEHLESNSGICAVPCGHTFHTHCLLQWLERSKTCPQCRKKTNDRQILKLYFDAPATEPSQIDAGALQNQIDNNKFQLCLKDKEIKVLSEENVTKEFQIEGLRSEFNNVKEQLKKKQATISSLESNLQILRMSAVEADEAKKLAKLAHAELKKYQAIERLLEECKDDIDEGILSSSMGTDMRININNCVSFICVLKQQMKKIGLEKRRLKDQYENLKSKCKTIQKTLLLKDTEIKSLQAANSIISEEKDFLLREIKSKEKKISSLENAILSPSEDTKNSAIRRLIRESPAPLQALRKVSPANAFVTDFVDLTPEVVCRAPKVAPEATSSSSQDSGASPYLRVKESSMNPLMTRRMTMQPTAGVPFAARKKAHFGSLKRNFSADDEIGYDGMGGHHKPDYFPQLKPRVPPVKKNIGGGAKVTIKLRKGNVSIGQNVTTANSIKNFFQNTFDE